MARTRPAPAAASYADLLERFFQLGFHLIPLDRGGKKTTERDWHRKGETDIESLVMRTAAYLGDDPATVAAELLGPLDECTLNFGVLNDPSGVLILDMDDPKALDAIQAGLAHIGQTCDEWGGLVWASPRGLKRLWARPKSIPPGVRKLTHRERGVNGLIVTRTLVEMRSAGQDMLPGGWRADKEFRLTIQGAVPAKLAPPPAALVILFEQMQRDHELVSVMQLAGGVKPGMTGMDAITTDDYPSRLAGKAHERAVVNAQETVEGLLEEAGARRSGKRWTVPGQGHGSPGIAPPVAGRAKLWQCWHESSPLAGQFDAWRAFVELRHGGDLEAAVSAARAMGRAGMHVVPDAPKPARKAPNPVTRVREDFPPRPRPKREKKAAPEDAPVPPRRVELHEVSKRFQGGDIVTAAELLAADLQPPPLVMNGMCPLHVGAYLLAGRSKHGKSLLTTQWLLAMASGQTLGGMAPVDGAQHVLYLSMDDASDSRLADRIKRLLEPVGLTKAQTKDALARFHTTSVWPPPDVDGVSDALDRMDALEALLEHHLEHGRPIGLVVIDTLTAWELASEGKDIVREQYGAVRPLQTLANEYGCAFVIVHHTRKGTFDHMEPFDEISGTQGRVAAADGMMVLHRTNTSDEHRYAVFYGRFRNSGEIDATLELNGLSWEHVGPATIARNSDKPMYDEVLEILFEAKIGERVQASTIYDTLKERDPSVKLHNVRMLLSTLSRGGQLVSKKGRAADAGYELAPEIRAKMAHGRKF